MIHRTDGFLPISAYGLIGDGRSAALVGLDGSIDWLCWPRFDSPSVFGRILDRGAGHFSVAPTGVVEVTRAYRPRSSTIATRSRTQTGVLELLDFMAAEPAPKGRIATRNALARSARCVEGEVEVYVDLVPRFDYGARAPRFRAADDGRSARADELAVASSHPLRIHGDRADASIQLRAGERLDLVASWDGRPPDDLDALLDETERTWARWASDLTYDGPYRDAVERSALTLKLLDYAESGAIVAAPTTSLPERIGGVRNWDYRFGWIRDVAFSAYALRRVGFDAEAGAFLDWTFHSARCRPAELQILYGIDGEPHVPERTLDHLEGYRGSAPVRVGNAAAEQLQLDTYGELLDCLHLWRRAGEAVTPAMWQCVRSLVDWLADNWERPDEGIWEVRSEPERFTYSATMAQVAFDRAVRTAEEEGLDAPVERWRRERDRAHHAVVEEAWSEKAGSFARTIGGDELDASVLALPLRRVVPADDPRMRSTVETIARELGAGGGLLYRYLEPDGLPEGEGGFLICSFWMVDCLAMRGDADDAAHLYETLLGYGNDLGLFSEEVDPSTGGALGNFPQAFSHIGVIASAVNLTRRSVPDEP